ncbi:MAG: hypothetical protein LBE07_03005 [Gordonia sp. (in: high G+C Gram-positive bacteria)]|nr:hypothetical protein [Gordonia sp. (in: high G+C Gram-positive bacteria)]
MLIVAGLAPIPTRFDSAARLTAPTGQPYAGGAGGRVEAWSLGPDELIDGQGSRVGDHVAADEWRTYIPGVDYAPPCP